jgi:hypothetical protein
MSSASTIGLPFLKTIFEAPIIVSETRFDYILLNNFTIPTGNYLAWIYLEIEGNVDTELGTVLTIINNGAPDVYSFTVNSSLVNIEAGTIAYQNTQVISITTPETISLSGSVFYTDTTNAPTITGTLYFYPI